MRYLVYSLLISIFCPLYAAPTDEPPVPKYIEKPVAHDGNFLFYNQPVALAFRKGFVVAYLTSDGKVMLDYWNHQHQRTASHVIHDYSSQIDPSRGKADDHAAPAIIHDAQNKRVLLATAYHNSDMYVYSHSYASGDIKLLSTWSGRYTYPRFIEADNDIALLARNYLLTPQRGGHLVIRGSHDAFKQEDIVIAADDGEVIYAGSPAFNNGQIYIAHSVYDHEQPGPLRKYYHRLRGLQITQFDVKKRKPITSCNLEALLDQDYYANRPTGLGIKKNSILIGAAFSGPTNMRNLDKTGANFSTQETVMIIKGQMNDCRSFASDLRWNNIRRPYYDINVAINDQGEYLFFDKNRVITNWGGHNECFQHEAMMYPHFMGQNALFYAKLNGPYSIRDFDNSLFVCIRQ